MFEFWRMLWCFAFAPLYFGGGGGSSSSASTTTNTDKRLVVSGGMGITSDGGSMTVNALDNGAVNGALKLATASQDAAATNYDKLLKGTGAALTGIFSLADKALSAGYGSLAQSQSNAGAMVDTKQSAGTLDNRTITILGVSVAIAVGAFAMRRH